jgi:Asp-tRNA(Asn)/Glu-tRNA(Gln) amidotransferase A subunit family amidase
MASGRAIGPLHGVPVGVKDIIDVAACLLRAARPRSRTGIRITTRPSSRGCVRRVR